MAVPAVCSTGRAVEPAASASKVRWQLHRDHSLEPLAPSDESTEANRDRLDLDQPVHALAAQSEGGREAPLVKGKAVEDSLSH